MSVLSMMLLSCSQNQPNSLTTANLIGRVKSVTLSTFYTKEKFGEAEKAGLSDRVIILYNEQGNRVGSSTYNADGLLSEKIKYLYDEKGNEIGENNYNRDGTLRTKSTSKVDQQGHPIEYIRYSPEGVKEYRDARENKYNRDRRLIEVLTISEHPERDSFKISRKYNTKGDVIEAEYQTINSADSSSPSITTFKYEGYDKAGNWKKQIPYDNGRLFRIVEHEVEYYD